MPPIQVILRSPDMARCPPLSILPALLEEGRGGQHSDIHKDCPLKNPGRSYELLDPGDHPGLRGSDDGSRGLEAS